MYKIMLVDDEGIVLDSLKYIIEKNFGTECQTESAKTGRAAIELAESFRPDIVFMDIQMPGLNGLEAMKEMQSRNSAIVFIVLSAYDKFNYAKQAIDLGVLEYMMKPFSSSKIVEVLNRAISQIDQKRQKISNELKIKEKLKTVIPVLENGFVYTIMFQNPSETEVENYKNLLGIEENYGYTMIMEYGDEQRDGELTNPVGASVKVQKVYEDIRNVTKDFFRVYIGTPMANRIAMFVPYPDKEMDYSSRIAIIENARVLVRKLTKDFEMQFKMGIGSLYRMEEVQKSYQEATEAVRNPKAKVTHIQDIAIQRQYEDAYPIELENKLFDAIEKGNTGLAINFANLFFEWMMETSSEDRDSISLKVLEFVLRAEHIAHANSGLPYQFNSRTNYLGEITDMPDYVMLRKWFLDKVIYSANSIGGKEEKQASNLVERACAYIEENFSSDISLDEVSKEVNISPYYFSKLFKEEMKENFVEYVTRIRVENAKKLLKQERYSIKEICVNCGYSDPNYFSRIFKKTTGVTPTEYRERGEV